MTKSIRQVKSKKRILNTLTSKLQSYRGVVPIAEQNLLQDFISLDPVFAGHEDKFNFTGTREQWIKFHAELDFKFDSGHWMEFGVREGTTIEQFLTYRPTAHIHGFDSWQGLPEAWKVTHSGPIQLLHVDGDLYSSARTVLTKLNDRIVPGTVIIFDEIANWRLAGKMSEWCDGEWLALIEWIETFNREVKPLARSCLNQASVEVLN